MSPPDAAPARTHRVFFALWPDAGAAARLASLGQALTAHGGRAMRPATLHLTLAFVGAVSTEQLAALRYLAATVRGDSFALRLDRLGCWPQRGVLWAGCHEPPSALRRLSADLMRVLVGAGFAVARHGEKPVPHVTLARRVRSRDLPPLETPVAWQVEEFVLVESHLHPSEASYRRLATFSLGRG